MIGATTAILVVIFTVGSSRLMLTTAVHNAAAASRIRRNRVTPPWESGELWSSDAKRSWLSKRWFTEHSCPRCRTIHDISPDGHTYPTCNCHDEEDTGVPPPISTHVPFMTVHNCPGCSCAFSSQQKTSANYAHIAKCLAASERTGCGGVLFISKR